MATDNTVVPNTTPSLLCRELLPGRSRATPDLLDPYKSQALTPARGDRFVKIESLPLVGRFYVDACPRSKDPKGACEIDVHSLRFVLRRRVSGEQTLEIIVFGGSKQTLAAVLMPWGGLCVF